MAREIRFRTIVLVFNIVIVLSFLFVFLFPLLLLGSSYFSLFISRNWIAGALFLCALAAVNTYFALNARLFGLLEREDWPGLVAYLEDEVYRKGRVRAKQVRLLANAYLITSTGASTRKLEELVREKRPGLMDVLALPLGIPYLVAAGSDESERYFAEMAARPGVRGRAWLRWDRAFCLCRRAEREAARRELDGVLDMRPEPVLRLLALYLLATACADSPGAAERAEAGRAQMARAYPPARWPAVVERSRGNVQALILSKVIADAGAWLHPGQPEAPGRAGPA